MDSRKLLKSSKNSKMDVFLLTKPPKSDRSRICLQLAARSNNAVLYLTGDGVYNLLDDGFKAIPCEQIFACKEEMEARGVQSGTNAVITRDFYERLLEDMMPDENRIYTF